MKYSALVEVYEQLQATTKRLEKTQILAEFLKKADNLDKIILLLQGRVFPNWDQRELGMASRLVLKSMSVASGASFEKVEKLFNDTGDLGTVAEKLITKKSQATLFSKALTVEHVFENLQKIAEMEGQGVVDRKTQLVAELLTSASPSEAKYIVRTVLSDLRIGLGDGTIRDAIVWAFFGDQIGFTYDSKENELKFDDEGRKRYDHFSEVVQEAFDVVNDFSEVVDVAAKKGEKGLLAMDVRPGHPVKTMLFQKAKTVEEGFETVGKPAAIEYKYDGFRLQIHKLDTKVVLYTRRLEDVTAQFPDVVARVKKCVKAKEAILDCEVVGFDPKTKKYQAFQDISQRIKRKYDIEEMAQRFPVEVNCFDLIYVDGKTMLKVPFEERRKMLEKIIKEVDSEFKLAKHIITDSKDEAEKFYKESLTAGNEGVMMKNEQGIYKPGARVGFGIKIKPTMDTLEVVIVGGEWGEGKRSKWIATYIIAVRDDDNQLVEIGRVGTGFKEKDEEGVSFNQITELLKPNIVEEKGMVVRVKPKVVIEVDYEEVQKSPTYSSGFALRFPRFVKLREDRGPKDINTLEDVKALAGSQRGRDK